ncbi:hypothetical protein [Frigoribacterium sp. CFBP 8751]|uniref:hypothetical protein n=1 Tax=Frigoribacterium sp. CFBP 8751 TaxID=2775277 RepID=UPI0017839B02|nr:hypothetical protein [Frigoribacterium sp. CFBP 8751]MBD8539558.1 hypothetical protein [Frigoribacterium sp. CFBP 8751]
MDDPTPGGAVPAPETPSDDQAAASLRALVEQAAADLAAREARTEALARYKPARRIVVVKTAESLEPAGRAWRLGVLLLGTDGRVFETGRITRAVTPTRSQHLSAQVEQRKAERRAAVRGHFAEGEVVNYAYEPVDLSTAALQGGEQRLLVRGGHALVRWGTATGEVRDLAAYLADRAELL